MGCYHTLRRQVFEQLQTLAIKIKMISEFLRSHLSYVEKIFELCMFAGCLIFVLFQGKQCFTKFLEKPEVVKTSFDFTGKHPFPEITFCPNPMNQGQCITTVHTPLITAVTI